MLKKTGTIQVDLDGLWTNLKYYGHDVETSPDMVFESAIPRFLDLFERYNIKATFFLIGKDGEMSEKAALIKQLSKAGHEIANHTYSHIFGLRKLSWKDKLDEIRKGGEVIERLIGKKPVGFKAPGYDIDTEMLGLLEREGYLYDSSVIPTPVYPLIMKLNHIFSGGIKRTHGPRWSWMFAPNKIYRPSFRKEWKKSKGEGRIMELPCSVMPFFRLPHHATFATKFGLNYFNLAQGLLKLRGGSMNYEFHAVDLSDEIKDRRLTHLNTAFDKRYKICKDIIKQLSKDYELITSKELVRRVKNG